MRSLNRLKILLMLKSIHHTLLAFMAKTAVCSLAVGLVLPAATTADAQETTNKLVRVITKREGENTRFLVENLEATEITATFELKLTNLKTNAGSSLTGTYPANKIT